MLDVLNKFRESLEASINDGLGMLTFDRLIEMVKEGSVGVFYSDIAIVVFETKNFNGKTFVNTILSGGELNGVMELQGNVEDMAKSIGAVGSMIIGRKGWGRVFDGYKDVATIYFKEFTK